MTATATALPTGFATTVDDADALVVGFLYSFPRHPRRGSAVRPFAGADTSAAATGVIGIPLYALVSVKWATEVTTIESDGSTTTSYESGWLGAPQGTSWYLHPAIYDADQGVYALDGGQRYAAGVTDAPVPDAARKEIQGWGCGGPAGVPDRARVHNFPL